VRITADRSHLSQWHIGEERRDRTCFSDLQCEHAGRSVTKSDPDTDIYGDLMGNTLTMNVVEGVFLD
jgi:hypothetical protein